MSDHFQKICVLASRRGTAWGAPTCKYFEGFGAAVTPIPAARPLQGLEKIDHAKSLVSANGVAETPIMGFETLSMPCPYFRIS